MSEIDPYYQAKHVIRDVLLKHMATAGYKQHLVAAPKGGYLYGIALDGDGVNPFVQEVLDMFTQQHYEAFARTIESSVMSYDLRGDAEGRRVTVELLNNMIAEFEKDNPKFKKLKFIESALAKANAVRDEMRSLSQKE